MYEKKTSVTSDKSSFRFPFLLFLFRSNGDAFLSIKKPVYFLQFHSDNGSKIEIGTPMQNIDYSRKLRSGRPFDGEVPSFSSTSNPSLGLGSATKPKSAFILLIGGILLFTSGLVVGIQLGQKESKFKENAETSFSNVGTKSESHPKLPETLRSEESKPFEGATASQTQDASPFPATLKFPPKNDQINYMVQIGDFSPEEAVTVGKQLLESQPNLRGRIFRTSTGKLFAGYFYRLEDAKETLDAVKGKLPNLIDAQVKTIRF
nr:hypothetical protein [Leptospira jelokensis]